MRLQKQKSLANRVIARLFVFYNITTGCAGGYKRALASSPEMIYKKAPMC